MNQKSGFSFKMPILFLIQFILLISKPLVRGSDGLTQSELKANYGQGVHVIINLPFHYIFTDLHVQIFLFIRWHRF